MAATICTVLASELLDTSSSKQYNTSSRYRLHDDHSSPHGGMFNSLKNSFSRKGRQPDPSSMSNNPYYSNQAPPPPYTPESIQRVSTNPFRRNQQPEYAPSQAPTFMPPTPSASTVKQDLNKDNDKYAFLETFDTIFLIDDSGSMYGSRWQETEQALEAITPICTAHDADGIDIYFLNAPDSDRYKNVKNPETVQDIFMRVSPNRATPTGQKLNKILKAYLDRFMANPAGTKPINIICITDGEASDDVESPLIAAAKKLDSLDAPAWQIGVQFFQVGKDEAAREALKALDDDLAEIAGDSNMRDIVDTVPFTGANGGKLTGDGILKVVLGAVNRRLDRKKSKDLHQ